MSDEVNIGIKQAFYFGLICNGCLFQTVTPFVYECYLSVQKFCVNHEVKIKKQIYWCIIQITRVHLHKVSSFWSPPDDTVCKEFKLHCCLNLLHFLTNISQMVSS